MIIQDSRGASVDLNSVVGQFNEVRTTGVNVNEISDILTKNGVSNQILTDATSTQLQTALDNGSTAIVHIQLADGQGHFLVVDGMSVIDGVPYYLTRDPVAGARGIRSDILDLRMSGNSIVIGK